MMDVERLLFDLHIYSGSGCGYALTVDAVNLRLVCGEDWTPTLKSLHDEVAKLRDCSYDSFRGNVRRISSLAWERNRKLLEKYAYRELEKPPGVKDFIEILYIYILRNKQCR